MTEEQQENAVLAVLGFVAIALAVTAWWTIS